MRQQDLIDYKLSQSDNILVHSNELRQQGFVKDYKDVYPDIYKRINSQKGTAYIRGNVSLKLLSIIYDTVIVSVPPLTKKQLEMRFDLKWDEFIKLCNHNIVIPIIGNADYYTGNHFKQLFDLLYPPCSLWARGLALLDVFGMEDTLDIAKDVLPVDAIAEDIDVLKLWRNRYATLSDEEVKQRIKRDIAVQYADLCIFGHKNTVRDLVNLSPNKLYRTLKLMNEIITYPVLFGLNSQANFNYKKLNNLSNIQLQKKDFRPLVFPQKELEILYGGIGIDTNNILVEDIISYHNDSLGIKLRSALSSFNGYCDNKFRKQEMLSMSEVYTRAEIFQKEFKVAVKDLDSSKYAKIDKAYDAITKTLKIGTVAIGAAVAFNENTSQVLDVLTVIGTAGSLISALPEETAELITKIGLSGFQSRFVSNMWSAKRIVERK